MRGNSGFLRWLLSSYSSAIEQTLLFGCLFAIVLSSTDAGPLNARPRRMIRDVYSEFESQSQNITQPTEGTCLHDGIAVPETSVQCEKKSGCRAIQKTGYCCPDYQCDCERDGKIYANGEKLVDPEEPCKGCYCQGGEILCNKVNCYIRHDCEPKFVPGRCCPEYDNCPPIDSGLPHLMSTTSTTTERIILTESSESSSSASSTTSSLTKQQEMANNNPLGIKIKEITKPEEIRIIDEKPKPTYQLIKPFDSTASNQPKIYAPTAPRIEIQQAQISPVVMVSSSAVAPDIPNEVSDGDNPPSSSLTSQNGLVSEINTSSAEASTEAPNKLESAEANSITDEDAQKIVRHTDTMQLDQAIPEAPFSSTDSSLPEKDIPENVGKEVVIVDSNGQTKPITVFGVEGLQRGDVFDEVLEFDEKKSASKRSDSPLLNVDSTTEFPIERSTGSKVIYESTSSKDQSSSTADSKSTGDVESVGSSSDEFIQVTATARRTDATTERLVEDSSNQTAGNAGEIFDSVYYSSGSESSDIEDSEAHSSIYHTVYREPDQSALLVESTEGPKAVAMDSIDDDGIIDEPNPAYPTIVDDLSVYQSQILAADEDMTVKDEKILPDILDLLTNSTYSVNGTTGAPESWLKNEMQSSSTEGVLIDNETALIPEQRAPGEPLLIPEWERNGTESSVQNITSDDSLEEESLIRDGINGDGTEIDASLASGDGSKERESTTPNARKLIDIDEDGSGRIEHDPKEDTESLKYQDDSDLVKPYLDTGIRSIVNTLDDVRQTSFLELFKFF